MNQKERVFWSDLMVRIEPDAAMYAAAEARLRDETDAPLDEAWVRTRLAGIVAAETQTRRRQRRRRLGAVAVLLVFALPALALGTRAILWQSTGSATDTLTYSEATGIMWNQADERRDFALGILTARIAIAIDAFHGAEAAADPAVAAVGEKHLKALQHALKTEAEPSAMPTDNDWLALAKIAGDPHADVAQRLQQLDRLAVLAIGALHVIQHSPRAAETSDLELARAAMLRHLGKHIASPAIPDGR